MRKTVITAGNILTPLGDLDSTWQGLLAGRSGLRVQGLGVGGGDFPLGFIEGLEGDVGSLGRQESLFSHLVEQMPKIPSSTALFCATTKAAVDELLQETEAAEGQPWQIAESLAQRLGIRGEVKTVSAACVSSLVAMIQGAMAIQSGKCDRALVIGFDLLSEFVVSGFASLKGLSQELPKPYDKERSGLALADGAGWALLAAEEVLGDDEERLACMENWGMSCDATHITAPCRYGSGLGRLLEQITNQCVAKIGGINGHGTATVYNDAMELLAFGRLTENTIPLCSVKGSLGHSLAAAGIIEAMLSVKSLKHQLLPPTVGLKEPEETCLRLSGLKPLPLLYPSVLTCNSGFGGINAGLLLTPA